MKEPQDILYFFARKGVNGEVPEDKCTIVDDKELLRWLRTQEDYEEDLKTR